MDLEELQTGNIDENLYEGVYVNAIDSIKDILNEQGYIIIDDNQPQPQQKSINNLIVKNQAIGDSSGDQALVTLKIVRMVSYVKIYFIQNDRSKDAQIYKLEKLLIDDGNHSNFLKFAQIFLLRIKSLIGGKSIPEPKLLTFLSSFGDMLDFVQYLDCKTQLELELLNSKINKNIQHNNSFWSKVYEKRYRFTGFGSSNSNLNWKKLYLKKSSTTTN